MPGFLFRRFVDFLANSAADHCSRCDAGPDQSLALIGSYVGTLLDSTDHGWQVFLEIYEMVLAEQDRRSGVLSGLDHQDLGEVYQDFP
jgi:hypothetical protein